MIEYLVEGNSRGFRLTVCTPEERVLIPFAQMEAAAKSFREVNGETFEYIIWTKTTTVLGLDEGTWCEEMLSFTSYKSGAKLTKDATVYRNQPG